MVNKLKQTLFSHVIHSMRTKALVLIGVIVLVTMTTAFYAMSKKDDLQQMYQQIQTLNKQSQELTKAHLIVIEVLTDLLVLGRADGNYDEQLLKKIHLNFLQLVEAKMIIVSYFPSRLEEMNFLLENLAQMVMKPSSTLVSDVLKMTQLENKKLVDSLQEKQLLRSELSKQYLEMSNRTAAVVLIIVIFVVLLSILMCYLYFSRLALNMQRGLKQIQLLVRNQKPPELKITQRDEIGRLFSGINQLSTELDKKDQQLAFSRYTYFNQVRSASVKHLVGGLIHELGNPVAGIKGLIYDFRSCESEEKEGQLQLIEEQIENLDRLNRQLIHFASGDSLDSEIIDISEQIRQFVYFLKLDERWYPVSLDVKLQPSLPAIFSSKEQISLLFNNICDNALVALQTSGKKIKNLSFGAYAEGNLVIVEIADNGIGMSKQLIDRCMEPYVTTQTESDGAGFGLTICRSVMEDLGGKISVESESGKGCRVKLIFSGVE